MPPASFPSGYYMWGLFTEAWSRRVTNVILNLLRQPGFVRVHSWRQKDVGTGVAVSESGRQGTSQMGTDELDDGCLIFRLL